MPDGEKEKGRTRRYEKGPLLMKSSEPLKCRLKEGNYAARRLAGGSLNRTTIGLPRRPHHQDVVPARSRHLEGALCVLLALHLGKIDVVPGPILEQPRHV